MPHFPHKHRNYQWWALFAIMLVAFVFRFQHIKTIPPGLYPDEAMNGNNAIEAMETGDYKVYYPENNGREGLFINLQAQSIKLFGNQPWALRVVAAFFGLLTVLGLYFLTRELFNWQIASLASFFLAVSFWHTLFSRIGFRAIMAPFLFVWGLYFMWKGKRSARLWDFAMAGLFFGLGFYTYIAFRVMPLVILLTLAAYWYYIHKDYGHDKYIHIRNQLTRCFAMMMLVVMLVAAPIGWYYFRHPTDFMGRTSQVSIFSSDNPVQSLTVNTIKTLGMFNFIGDNNWRHNAAGSPLLFWPIGIFFAIGFIRAWYKLLRHKQKHGHHPTVQVLLLSWFFIGLLPVVISNEGIPHALRAILVAPVVMIFAGEGLWFLYDLSRKWYHYHDSDEVVVHQHHAPESSVVASLAVLILLATIMVAQYKAYFVDWANNPNVAQAFSERYVQLGNLLNTMPREEHKYILVNSGSDLVRGIPVAAQTVMFITDTWSLEKQKAKNIYYLTEADYKKGNYQRKNSTILLLNEEK